MDAPQKIRIPNPFNMKKLLITLTTILLFCSFMANRHVVTIYMIGDSTMANKPLDNENQERGWGMVLDELLQGDIRVENHAVNGRSSKSFIDEGRWDVVLSRLHEGDYVVIQFGHNDEKPKEDRHTDPQTTFRANLIRFVQEARSKGAKPILMNSIVRRKFEAENTNRLTDTHGEYAVVPGQVAMEMGVPYVDAHALTRQLVESYGPERSKELFMWVPAGQFAFAPDGKQDDTHLNALGSRLVARLLLDEMARQEPSLQPFVRKAPAHSGTPFTYKGMSLQSHERCLYVNPAMPTNADAFTFAHVADALRYAQQQADDSLWSDIFIEPSVYWMDDPDSPDIRQPRGSSSTPFAMELRLNRVRMTGMTGRAEDVVLACNRGHTQGANGNFTMLHLSGNEVEARGITFGNYCNVDLVYPLRPELNRPKRKEAIVQAQLVICDGGDYRLTNCRFISRLNLCPFSGARNADFDHCYLECTDDALCPTATYRHCSFTFYSSKPFYSTYGSGARFVDCDIHSKVSGTQYLTKVSGPVSMERCRWTSDDPNLKIEWNKRPDPRHLCVMTDCTLNGQPLLVPTPTEPLPVALPPMPMALQPHIVPGAWTVDSHKPSDTQEYSWQPDTTRSAWAYAEGVDGAEGCWGMVQTMRGARLMYTPRHEEQDTRKQACTVELDPCKSAGQGFGSATAQYLDICIKFDTRTLTGYGLRFVRTPDYDKAVEASLVEYDHGTIRPITSAQRCDLFRAGCIVRLQAEGDTLTASISNSRHPELPEQHIRTTMPHPNTFGGFHLQHTGTVGAAATVIRTIMLK